MLNTPERKAGDLDGVIVHLRQRYFKFGATRDQHEGNTFSKLQQYADSAEHQLDGDNLQVDNRLPAVLDINSGYKIVEEYKSRDGNPPGTASFVALVQFSPSCPQARLGQVVFKVICKDKYRLNTREKNNQRRLYQWLKNNVAQCVVPQLIAVGDSETAQLFVMEKIAGDVLTAFKAKVRNDSVYPRMLQRICEAVFTVLQSLHNARFVHRDLKLDNMLLLWNKPFESPQHSTASCTNLDFFRSGTVDETKSVDRFNWDMKVSPAVIDLSYAVSSADAEFDDPKPRVCGTPQYMSPKMVNYFHLCNSSSPPLVPEFLMDSQSAALSLYEVAACEPFFQLSGSVQNRLEQRVTMEKIKYVNDRLVDSSFLTKLESLKSVDSTRWRFPNWFIELLLNMYTEGNFQRMRELLNEGYDKAHCSAPLASADIGSMTVNPQ